MHELWYYLSNNMIKMNGEEIALAINKPVRSSLTQQVQDEILNMIRDKEWTIGQRIPPETEMAAIFGVSRNTIREAVKSLEFSGILESKVGAGTYVRSENLLSASVTKRLSAISFREIYEMRSILEPGLVALAAHNRTADEVKLLEKALIDCKSASTPEDVLKYDQEFHLQIAKMAHNSILLEMYKAILPKLYDYTFSLFVSLEEQISSGQVQLFKEHNDMFDAISRQDACAAHSIVEQYLTDMNRRTE